MRVNAMVDYQNLLKLDEKKALKKSISEFTAYFFYQIFKEMWESIPKSGLLPETSGEKFYRDMLLYEYSKKLTDSQMKSLNEMLYRSLAKKAYENAR